MPLEVTSKESIEEVYQHISSKEYRFDAVINNAAVRFDFEKEMLPEELATDTFNINTKGTINLTNKILPFLKPKGRIINVSSIFARLDEH